MGESLVKISFICNYIYINNGWSPWDTRLGGSEEFIVEVSKRLAKDQDVAVYHNGKHGTYKGVRYLDHNEFEPGDITINVNYPEWESRGRSIYWTSLDKNPDLSHFDAVCVISEYAKCTTGVKHDNVYLVSPGYDPKQIYPGEKVAKQCFYASSPDRGLDILLEAWPKVFEKHPDATLIVTYNGNIDLPGVMNMGDLNEEMMNEVYRTSDIWCHPCTGGELYCMTGKKAQVSGCIPVIIPTMALSETVRRGYKIEDPKDYAQVLIEVLNQPMELRNVIRKDVIKNANAVTWGQSTDKLLQIIETVLN